MTNCGMHFAMFLKWKGGEINRKTQNKKIISSSAVDLLADFRSIPAGAARPEVTKWKKRFPEIRVYTIKNINRVGRNHKFLGIKLQSGEIAIHFR